MIGKISFWIFVLFNLLMLLWLAYGLIDGWLAITNASTELERTWQTKNLVIGMSYVLPLWAFGATVIGLVILLTTRRKSRDQAP